MARPLLVSCPDRTLYAREGLVHLYIYFTALAVDRVMIFIVTKLAENLDLVHQTFPRVEGVVWARDCTRPL